MRVCLMVEGQEGVTWEEWLALARAAEGVGLDGLFRSDHYTTIVRPVGGALDAWATLSALAAVTSRIRLGTMVSPATFRHPSVLARLATTVDHVSGGRVEVGLGAGWYEREHLENGFPFGDERTRFEIFAEQVEVVVGTWTEDPFDFAGEHYTLTGQRALPRPVQQPHPPLILGGSARPRSAALAARFAAEYNTPFATLDQCRERRAALDRACEEAGRDPATLPLSLMTMTVVGRDEAEVRERARRVVALRGGGQDLDAFLAARDGAQLVGTVEQVAERLAALKAAGVTGLFAQHLAHEDTEAVATLGALARAVAGA